MFITLEGIEGSGKSTQLKNIAAYLDRKGIDTFITREPGGTAIGEKIRAILLNPESGGMEPLTELFLYEADRVEHLKKKIIPALAAGKTVVCDRFYDATIVYQGYARGLDLDFIQRIHCLMLEDLKPDLTLLFDLKPQIGLSRAWGQINNGRRTGDESRFEKETLVFHEKIRAGYLELARLEPQRFHIIDASRDPARVKEDAIARLGQALKQKRR